MIINEFVFAKSRWSHEDSENVLNSKTNENLRKLIAKWEEYQHRHVEWIPLAVVEEE